MRSSSFLPASRPFWALAVDAACVVIFSAAGRSSHDEANTLGGVVETAWPFISGLLVGWVLCSLWATRAARPGAGSRTRPTMVMLWPAGCVVVLSTWGLGMLLRLASGQGASGAFPLVAIGFLAVTMLGWRALAWVATRRRTPSPAA